MSFFWRALPSKVHLEKFFGPEVIVKGDSFGGQGDYFQKK